MKSDPEFRVILFETLKEVDFYIENLSTEWLILNVITRPYNELSHYVVVIYKER